MERITKKTLYTLVERVNKYTKHKYGLDIAYGGYRLIDETTHRCISYRLTARELYYVLDGIEELLCNEKYS